MMAASSKDDSKYDVYLSSGGEDTRRTFTDHLYCSLKDHRVNVFMYGDEYDDKLEESNGAIPEHLIQAIERSKVAVVVFSRGYPESLWCLKELMKIMECRETLGQVFFPIFFDVDPSDVRKQSGSFAQAFQKYEQKFNEDKVCLWIEALWEAGVLAGLNFRETDGHEGNFIRNVISQITGKQSITTSLEVPTSLVGIDSRVREISKHLNVGGSNDIRTIGILGMCGLGKTTVAKAIFNKHHRNFDGASFLENVREKKLVDLQEQFLSDILKPAYIGVSCIDEGTKEIEQRLGNGRVLVVIDDLDSVEQIDALAIKPDSFGPGSRIIVTSRNKHLLKILNVDKICPLPSMSEREALELLSLHAFRKNYPHEEYVELSRKAVGYCGGLPLALEVLGSYLCSKSTSEWETVLDKWKRSQPYWEIHKRLEISYDGLTDDDVKAIFLDISCFFAGMNKDYVMTVLDGCQFYPEIGIRELQDQCLVTVDKEGNLMMHDLIQGMGKEIVRAESPDNPRERSRLWHNEDITDVLTKQSGTEDVEGLTLDMQESDECSFSSELFRNMQSLRLLKLNNIKLTGSYDNLSKELRWLCWHGFPLEVIPKDFDQPNLVAIDLSYSKLIRVWEDSDLLLEKLKLLNLSHSPNLAQTPDFSRLPNLEEVILNDCESLSEVHSSIGNLERLTLVNLEGCKNLKDLPLNFFNSKSIETLLLNGCSRFENLAEGLGKSYQKTADGTPIRQILRPSFSSQYVVKESPSTSLLPPSLHGLNYLRKLDLGCCTLTDDEIPKVLGSLTFLEDLDLRKNSFCSLPSLSGLSKLETLCLDDCTNLHAIPNLPTNLKVLRAGLCTALETMPDFSELLSMRELYLSHSCKLTDIPGLDKSLNSMTRIHMEGCINLTADFRKNILQGWTSCGYGGIFFNGNYIPDWFDFVKGDLVSCHVPLIVGRNFSGLTLCCIYSSKKQREGPLGIIVSNKIKCTALLARITYASVPTSCTLDGHYLWQGHISNYVLNLQGGDKVDIFVKPVEPADASVSVKKIGVNLVWDNFMKENMHDSDLLLYDFDQHPDWLLGADGYEGISRELRSNYLDIAIHPVGIDSRVQVISNFLDVEGSNDVRIIGILGMGGLGKTTVAKAVFKKHHHSFDGASFLPNVREDKKLVHSQNKLLSDILSLGNMKVLKFNEGTKEIIRRLGDKRVLVIVNDVDRDAQLDALGINHYSFGPGSRIIITTRDRHLLEMLNVDVIYIVQEMNKEEALELLSWHAFGKSYPNEEYVELSRKAVGYCAGLPLALEVLGSYLCTKSKSEWETVLDKWKRHPPREIQGILKISYDGLTDDLVKDVFLNIGCFFIGMNKNYVTTILDGCDLYPEKGIRELQDQCLVTVDTEGNLMMHDLIRDMAREIVHAQCRYHPGERSRLWHHVDVIDVLAKQSGTEDVEGLALDMKESGERSFSTEAFRKMRRLRLLKLNYVNVTGSHSNLSKELRWLCWHGFPLKVIPEDFDQPNLVAIDLNYSKLIRVWEDTDVLLKNLKIINLSHSHYLTESPDLSKVPNLEKLILVNCVRLSKIHPSIGHLERLSLVNLEDCKTLQYFPGDFCKSKSVETLILKGCTGFIKLKDKGEMVSSTTPQASHTMTRKLPSSMAGLKNLRSVLLSLHGLNSLTLLGLGNCGLTDDAIPKDLGSLFSLEILELDGNLFYSLPSLSGLSKLKMLDLSYCKNLLEIPDLPRSLEILRANQCIALAKLPNFSEMSSMVELHLNHSPKLSEILGLHKSLNTMRRIHMEGCTNLTADFRKNIIQGWTSCGHGDIFLNGIYDIPEWFQIVGIHEPNDVRFKVPCNFRGLTVCCVFETYCPGFTVTNITKRKALHTWEESTCWVADSVLRLQSVLSNDVLHLQSGDEVSISAVTKAHGRGRVIGRVMKTGINLVWDDGNAGDKYTSIEEIGAVPRNNSSEETLPSPSVHMDGCLPMASDLEKCANEAFIDDCFKLAVDLYTHAIAFNPQSAELYTNRAQANIKSGNLTEAVADANKAIEFDPLLYKAYLRKGIACIKLEEYQTAKATLEIGAPLAPHETRFANLIKECDEKIAEETAVLPTASLEKNITENVIPAKNVQPASQPSNQVTTTYVKPKYRPAFYQKPEEVVVTIFAEGISAKDVNVDFGEQKLGVSIDVAGEDTYHFQTRLFGKIIPEMCRFDVLSTKVEIRLAKAKPLHWTSLEFSEDNPVPLKVTGPVVGVLSPSYLSSKPRTNPVTVHPMPSNDANQPDGNTIVKAEPRSFIASGFSLSEEQHDVAGPPVKHRKQHRRKYAQNQEPSLMRGVYFKNMKWHAAIKVDKKQIHLGTVGSQEEAAHLYDRAAFMCGREPNFELSEEEKQELRKFKWDEFLVMTRHAITNKKHMRRQGAESEKRSESPQLEDSDWEDDKEEVSGLSASEDAEQDMLDS